MKARRNREFRSEVEVCRLTAAAARRLAPALRVNQGLGVKPLHRSPDPIRRLEGRFPRATFHARAFVCREVLEDLECELRLVGGAGARGQLFGGKRFTGGGL